MMSARVTMRRPTSIAVCLASVLSLTACARPRVAVISDCIPDPSTAPLLPAIHFREPTLPGTIAVLLLDAHTGRPLRGGYIELADTAVIAVADLSGRAVLKGVPEGRRVIEAGSVGYEPKRDTVEMVPQNGWVLVVQLRRAPFTHCPPTTGARR